MSTCGATHPHLPSESACLEPAGHTGQHMAHDSQGRPEYVWTAGDVWDWAPVTAPSPAAAGLPAEDVERVARALCDGDAEDHDTYTWDEASDDLRDDYRRAACHAIGGMKGGRHAAID